MPTFKTKPVKDQEIIRILDNLTAHKMSRITDRKTAIKTSMILKPIRKNIFLGQDTKYKRGSMIVLPPRINIEKMGNFYVFRWK